MASTPNCPDFVVNSFVTKQLKTFTSLGKFRTLRITLNDVKTTVNKLTFCCSTSLSIVTRSGCLIDIQEIIVKSFPKNKALFDVLPGKKCFENELFFYNEILLELNQFQADYDHAERIEAPILKGFSLEKANEALIFLQADHWIPYYKKCEENLSDGEIKAILDQLSRLHGVSYAYAKLKPEKSNIWNNKLSDNSLLYGFQNETTLNIVEKNLLLIEEKLKVKNLQVSEKLLHLSKTFKKQLNNAGKSSTFQCLLHGDPSSNFLIGYQDDLPSKVKLTNWNLVKFGSPVLDLSLFFFTNLSNYNHLDRYLDYYYDNLSGIVNTFGLSTSKEYSLKQFNEDWKDNGIFGMILASLIITFDWNNINQKLESSETTIEDFLSSCDAALMDKYLEQISNMIIYGIDNNLL